MRNTFVIDTSVLVSDFNVLFAYPDTDMILSSIVIDELDNLKKRSDEVGRNAREVIRILDRLTQSKDIDIQKGIKIENNINIRILIESDHNEKNYNEIKNDDRIILTAVKVKKTEGISPIIISQDAGLRIKAKIAGIEAINHDSVDKNIKNKDDFYSGITIFEQDELTEDELNGLFHDRAGCKLPRFNFNPNEFVRVEITNGEGKEQKKTIVWEGIYKENGYIYPLKNYKRIQDISPANAEQRYAFNLLMDPKINLVTLKGKAGSGKTLLSLVTALEQVQDGLYDRIIITKPTVPVGKELGFFPGTKEEKLNPWLGSIYDNLRVIKTDDEIDLLIERGIIEFEAVSLFRGRSIPNSILIIDESQNLTKIEAKTIITRSGKNTKVVMTYDSDQIDSPYLDAMTNGATHVTEKMKDKPIAGHITLFAGERSDLATIAAECL